MDTSSRPGKEIRNKDFLKIALDLVDNQGWRYRYNGKHCTLYPPDRTQSQVVFPSTPSDHRAIKNFKAQMRRAGGTV